MKDTPLSKSEPGISAATPARPPLAYWLMPLFVALLGSMPLLWLKVAEPPKGMVFMSVAYLPADFLAYQAFIKEASQTHSLLLARSLSHGATIAALILAFHWVAGLASAVTKLPPGIVMELARIVLVFGFFATWWWFLCPILPEARDRLWAGGAGRILGWFRELGACSLPSLAHPGTRRPADGATHSLFCGADRVGSGTALHLGERLDQEIPLKEWTTLILK
jgi:hypothetical protein